MRGYKKDLRTLSRKGTLSCRGATPLWSGASVFTISSGGPLHLSPCMISKGYRDTRPSSETKDALIDWIEFYAVSAIFQPCNGSYLILMFWYIFFSFHWKHYNSWLTFRVQKDGTGHVYVQYKKLSTEDQWHPTPDERPIEIFQLDDIGCQLTPPGHPNKVNPNMPEEDIQTLQRFR